MNSRRRFLNTTEAAEYLGLSRRTLEKWRTTGDGPTFVAAGGRRFYDVADLEAFVIARRRLSTSDTGSQAA